MDVFEALKKAYESVYKEPAVGGHVDILSRIEIYVNSADDVDSAKYELDKLAKLLTIAETLL